MPARRTPVEIASAVLRLVLSALVVTAVVATFTATAARATINPFNFFGYFTIQSNLLLAAILIGTAVLQLRGRAQPHRLVLARGVWTAYIVLVGVVYATLLAGREDGGVPVAWANVVVHVVFPVYGLLDWLLFADRPPLPWNRYALVLIYPIVWLVVVLVRGATDGWVPYPFLDPAAGYGTVAGYVVVIAAAFALMGVVAWALSRVRLLGDRGPVRP